MKPHGHGQITKDQMLATNVTMNRDDGHGRVVVVEGQELLCLGKELDPSPRAARPSGRMR